MREWEIGAVENIHGALPYIRFAPILALVGVGLNRIGKVVAMPREISCKHRKVIRYDQFLPIRLTPMTATCWVPPLSRVKLGIGWARGAARDAEQ